MKPKSYLKVLIVLMLISGSLFGCLKNDSPIPESTNEGGQTAVNNSKISNKTIVEELNKLKKDDQTVKFIFITYSVVVSGLIIFTFDNNRRISRNIDKRFSKENKQTLYNLQEQLNEKIKKIDETVISTEQTLVNLIETLETKIAKPGNNQTKQIHEPIGVSVTQKTPSYQTSKSSNINTSNYTLFEIIEIYNNIPRILSNKVTKVNLESSDGSSKEKLFIEVTNGNSSYWIIKTEDGKEWLLPSNKLKVNQHNEKSIQSFFEFQSYENSENKNFILVQPAAVSLLANSSRKEWKLETLGVLNFDSSYSTNEMRSQLKETQNERDQYQSELEKIKQEKEKLTTKLAQISSDSLEDMRYNLVTKKYFEEALYKIQKELQKEFNQKIGSLEVQQNAINKQIKKIEKTVTSTEQKLVNRIETVETKISRIGNNQTTQTNEYKTVFYSQKTGSIQTSQSSNSNTNNYSANSIPNDVIEVSETEKSASDRRLGKSKTVILEKKRRGNYLVYADSGYECLVPSKNLRVNQYNYKTIQGLFECNNYNPNYSNDFQVVQPAILNSISSGETWVLQQRGILEFSNTSTSVSSNAIKVSETKLSQENRRLGKSQDVILEKNRRGNYLVYKEGSYEYLVPSENLRINEFNYKTFEVLFEINNFNASNYANFKILQPAVVNSLSGDQKWQLKQRGVLQF
ncbi:hypothetical protein [Crocosphaera sp.]|uniref:hypothetical protein n=1 Tax=Crocosphaera sp. TaxID=2729996 RepID=UPI0026199E1D|nr:hypothetical protein [Crocosphaera sp.]MDJ0581742.1 hypothetical protein [Crocosphaera sp.]